MPVSLHFFFQYLFFSLRRTLLRWTKPATPSLSQGVLSDLTRTRAELMVENALLRQQLIVLQRAVRRAPLKNGDRLLLVVLASRIRHWKTALLIVQPETVLRWHRAFFSFIWKRKSKAKLSQSKLTVEAI